MPASIKPRPEKRGREIELVSNLYRLTIPDVSVFHYHVQVFYAPKEGGSERGSPVMNKILKRDIIQAMAEDFKDIGFAYDGMANVFLSQPLSVAVAEFKSADHKYQVTLKPVKKKESQGCAIHLEVLNAFYDGRVDSAPQEAITVIETILRHTPNRKFHPFQKYFYYPPSEEEDSRPLGEGKVIRLGYFQSVRLCELGPVLNLNAHASVFYENIGVIDFLTQFLNVDIKKRRLQKEDIKKASDDLKGVIIETKHRGFIKKYPVDSLTFKGATSQKFFSEENGEEQSVENYFEKNYGPLEYPHLPCIKVSQQGKPIYFPIEVCKIAENQAYRKDKKIFQSEMIKYTNMSPSERFEEIKRIFSKADFNNDPVLKKFNIKVQEEPLEMIGRILNPPTIVYQDDKSVKPRNGTWNMRDKQFADGVKGMAWTLLSFANREVCTERKLKTFAEKFQDVAADEGLELDPCTNVKIIEPTLENLQNIASLFDNLKLMVNFIFIVLPSQKLELASDVYERVKRAGDVTCGVITQCYKMENVLRFNPSLLANLCLKVNSKLGGTNFAFRRGETPQKCRDDVFFLGADVTHVKGHKLSIAAVLGGYDNHLLSSRYAATVREQYHEEGKESAEIIQDLREMVVHLLKHFSKKPKQILFFRDGIDDGQFEDVRDKEVQCIRDACSSVSCRPAITTVLVQKRHQVRFKPRDMRDGADKMRNVPPCTVVDNDVTHPINFDFYIYGQLGLMGTSCPAHYTVLTDDNHFTSDEIQAVTKTLCYGYARCTKGISLPAPVQYAHLAAYRARDHLAAYLKEPPQDLSNETHEKTKLPLDDVLKAITVHPELENAMYFI